jgi:hypothetical protein
LLIGLEDADQRVQMRSQQVLASDVQHDPLADLVALAEVLHQPEVFMAAVGGFDGAEEQGSLQLHYNDHTDYLQIQWKNGNNVEKVCHYIFSKMQTRPRIFNELRTEAPKKAQTWASYFGTSGEVKR